MVSIAATTPASISMKANAPKKSEEALLGSAKDIINTVEEKSKKFQEGAEQVQDAAKNIEKTVTGCATALTTSAGSLMAAGKVFKPLTNKLQAFMKKPGVQKLTSSISEKAGKVLASAKSFVKANPKAAIAAVAVIAAATAAIVITKAVLNAKAEQTAKTAEAAPAAATEKKLDVVSEA